MKDVTSADLLSNVLPQFFPAHWLTDAPDLLYSDFASMIRIGYVMRGNAGYTYIMKPAFETTGIPLETLHKASLQNLEELSEIGMTVGKTPGGSEAFLNETKDGFRAVRLLLPQVQDHLALELGDEFFVSIPSRDWFICWSKNQEACWQQKNQEAALSDFLEDDYNLTPDVLLRTADGFAVHLCQKPEVEQASRGNRGS